jgi:hypothetical protein
MDNLLETRLSRLAQQIGRLERKTDFILKHLNLEYTDDLEASIDGFMVEVYALLKQGKKMQALQTYRKHTGADASEAMTEIDKLEAGLKKK